MNKENEGIKNLEKRWLAYHSMIDMSVVGLSILMEDDPYKKERNKLVYRLHRRDRKIKASSFRTWGDRLEHSS